MWLLCQLCRLGGSLSPATLGRDPSGFSGSPVGTSRAAVGLAGHHQNITTPRGPGPRAAGIVLTAAQRRAPGLGHAHLARSHPRRLRVSCALRTNTPYFLPADRALERKRREAARGYSFPTLPPFLPTRPHDLQVKSLQASRHHRTSRAKHRTRLARPAPGTQLPRPPHAPLAARPPDSTADAPLSTSTPFQAATGVALSHRTRRARQPSRLKNVASPRPTCPAPPQPSPPPPPRPRRRSWPRPSSARP